MALEGVDFCGKELYFSVAHSLPCEMNGPVEFSLNNSTADDECTILFFIAYSRKIDYRKIGNQAVTINGYLE